MVKTRIFHTVNAGLYIQSPGARLLIDGLHQGKAEGCSPMLEALRAQAAEGTGFFFDLDGLLFTHLHGDHFDAALTAYVLGLPCTPQLLGADFDPESGRFSLEAASVRALRFRDMQITLLPSVHEGAMFAALPHNSLLLNTPDARLFIAGDAVLDAGLCSQVLACSGGQPFQALFINPMQLLSDCGKAFLRAVPAAHIFVYHIPFPEDDVFHYGQTAKWTVKACSAEFPNLSILTHMQWADLF